MNRGMKGYNYERYVDGLHGEIQQQGSTRTFRSIIGNEEYIVKVPKGAQIEEYEIAEVTGEEMSELTREFLIWYGLNQHHSYCVAPLSDQMNCMPHEIRSTMNIPWFAYYAPEEDFTKVLESGIGIDEKVKKLEEVLLALKIMHDAGYAHLNIRPENIVMVNGRWRFINLGNAGGEGSEHYIAFNGRESEYLAPEMIEKGYLGKVSDIWSMGMILYRILSYNRSPYGDDFSESDMLDNGPRIDLIPDSPYKSILVRALNHDQEYRIKTADAFRKLLNEVSDITPPYLKKAIAGYWYSAYETATAICEEDEFSACFKRYCDFVGLGTNKKERVSIYEFRPSAYKYLKASRQSRTCLWLYGQMERYGLGDGPANIRAAHDALKRSSNFGFALGQMSYGSLITEHREFRKEWKDGVKALNLAIDQGVVKARDLLVKLSTLEGGCGPELRWILRDEVLTITGSGDMVLDPEDDWSCFKEEIGKIVIGNGVRSIAANAFNGFSQVSEVSIPDTVVHIGQKAFLGCHNLREVTLPNTITGLGFGAFKNCHILKYVTLPRYDGLSTESVFDDGVEFNYTIVLETPRPEPVPVEEKREPARPEPVPMEKKRGPVRPAPAGGSPGETARPEIVCDASTSIGRFGENLQCYYDDGTLVIRGGGEMDPLTVPPWRPLVNDIRRVIVSPGVTSLCKYAFKDCRNLTDVSLPEGLTHVGTKSFLGCSSLETISLPSTVTAVAMGTFFGCGSLRTVSMPRFDRYNPDKVFDRHVDVVFVEGSAGETAKPEPVPEEPVPEEPDTAAISGSFGDNLRFTLSRGTLTISGNGEMDGSRTIPWRNYKDSVRRIIVEEGVTAICNMAFRMFSEVESVSLPESLTSIGNKAFQGCKSLREVTIPSRVSSVETAAFKGCKSLAVASMPRISGFNQSLVFDSATRVSYH